MNIDIHAIVRPRVGKFAGMFGRVDGVTVAGKFIVTVPIQRDGNHLHIITVRMLPAELYLVDTGATLDRWAEEDRLDRSPAAKRLRLAKPMPKTIDPYDGLESQEMPDDPILRKRMQERIATRRRLRAMSKQQLAEYYERRKQSRIRSRAKQREAA